MAVTTVEIALVLVLLLIIYATGYWHGSRIGAAQYLRALAGMQHLATPRGAYRLSARRPVRAPELVETANTTSVGLITKEEAQIITLFLSGTNASGVVATVYGLDISAGQIYWDRMAYVQAVIRADLAHYRSEAQSYDFED